jgi:hypothetical protein
MKNAALVNNIFIVLMMTAIAAAPAQNTEQSNAPGATHADRACDSFKFMVNF